LSQCVTAPLDIDEDAAWSALVSSIEQGLDEDEEVDGSDAAQDLLAHFLCIPDVRHVQWVEHPLAVVLALAAGAVVAGIRSFTAIAGWVEDAPSDLLAWLYVRCEFPVPLGPPSKTTLWRLVTGVDADALDLTIGAWLHSRAAAQRKAAPTPGPVAQPVAEPAHECAVATGSAARLVPLAVDGKVARGAKDEDGKQVRLLAAMLHDKRLVLNQVAVGAKTNEIPMLQPLLDPLDITDHVITADSLHTQRKTARYLHGRDAHFVFQVKGNQPKLFAALDALPWRETAIGHTATTKGHGRITTRTLQVLPAPKDLNFPHVHQVFLIERQVTDLKGRPLSNVAVLGVTDLTRPPGRRHHHRRIHPRPMGPGIPALAPRHPLPRRRLQRPNPLRPPRHGRPAQPRHRRPPTHRPHRHHRSHPLGQPRPPPTLQDPRTRSLILERP
jgi:predicted transposase YbfD/YdcC